jgi:uncharacterized GH25 family protein
MKKRIELLVVVAMALIAVACGGAAPQSTGTQTVDITFKSEPDPPKMGENTFEVMVMAKGQPITDADVAVEFFMAAMPSMNMAEMRNSVPLKHEGDGRYSGAGNVMMAGAWDATVTVRRGGQDLGSRKFSVTAK